MSHVSPPMQPETLNLPAGALMRAVRFVHLEDSLGAAAVRLREDGLPLIPVLDRYGRLAGVLSENAVLQALSNGSFPTDPVSSMVEEPATISPYESGETAIRRLVECAAGALVVVDGDFRPRGILLPSDLIVQPRNAVRPPSVGGMATPIGVYLTTGSISAGAGWKGLILTGMWMGSRLVAAAILANFLGLWLQSKRIPASWVDGIVQFAIYALFLGAMRFSPLSGTHAAEHMVVHAIERDEELVPETVKRMPRVHPRCGTNLAVGVTLFLGIAGYLKDDWPLNLFSAAIVTLFVWHPLGNFVQYWITTKTPNDRQIESGIAAGQELLQKFQKSGQVRSSIFQRIYCMGILHVMAGAFAISILTWAILVALGHPDWLPLV